MLSTDEVQRRRLQMIEEPRTALAIGDHCECDACEVNDECEYAFDPYNWNDPGQFCLAEK